MPADFFATPRPATVDRETVERNYGTAAPGSQREQEASRSFTPYWAGTAPSTPQLGGFCLASLDRLDFSRRTSGPGTVTSPDSTVTAETPSTAEPSKLTYFDATYNATANGCTPGTKAADSPALEVVSFSSGSTFGQQWTQAYIDEGQQLAVSPLEPDFLRAGSTPVLLGTLPTLAHVIVNDDGRTSALMTTGATTLIITGPFDKTTLQPLLRLVVPR